MTGVQTCALPICITNPQDAIAHGLFLVPEDQERWTNLREREENPVTIVQLNAILEWLVGEQTERPTQTPSPSGSGPGKTARSLKAA